MATRKKTSTKKTSSSKLPRTTRGRSVIVSAKVKNDEKTSPPKPIRFLRLRKSQLLIVGGLVILIALLYSFRGLFVAATVNGRPITRLSLVAELESRWGKATLDYLVSKELIEQEADKRKVKVEQKNIDAALKEDDNFYKAQGQTLDQVLSSRKQSKENYTKEEIVPRIQLMKMIEKETKVTDKELDQYIEQNKKDFPPDADPQELRKNVRKDLESQKLIQKRQEFLNKLHQDATLKYYINF